MFDVALGIHGEDGIEKITHPSVAAVLQAFRIAIPYTEAPHHLHISRSQIPKVSRPASDRCSAIDVCLYLRISSERNPRGDFVTFDILSFSMVFEVFFQQGRR